MIDETLFFFVQPLKSCSLNEEEENDVFVLSFFNQFSRMEQVLVVLGDKEINL